MTGRVLSTALGRRARVRRIIAPLRDAFILGVLQVLDRGCVQPTFQGAGFELAEAAAAATRTAVQLLLDGDGYPALSYDIATIDFRDTASAEPKATYTRLPRHPRCASCHE